MKKEKFKKLLTISVSEEGNIKYDPGKKPYPIFSMIYVLSCCISQLSKIGYDEEEKIYKEKSKNEH